LEVTLEALKWSYRQLLGNGNMEPEPRQHQEEDFDALGVTAIIRPEHPRFQEKWQCTCQWACTCDLPPQLLPIKLNECNQSVEEAMNSSTWMQDVPSELLDDCVHGWEKELNKHKDGRHRREIFGRIYRNVAELHASATKRLSRLRPDDKSMYREHLKFLLKIVFTLMTAVDHVALYPLPGKLCQILISVRRHCIEFASKCPQKDEHMLQWRRAASVMCLFWRIPEVQQSKFLISVKPKPKDLKWMAGDCPDADFADVARKTRACCDLPQ
jgi:hypothetical protein